VPAPPARSRALRSERVAAYAGAAKHTRRVIEAVGPCLGLKLSEARRGERGRRVGGNVALTEQMGHAPARLDLVAFLFVVEIVVNIPRVDVVDRDNIVDTEADKSDRRVIAHTSGASDDEPLAVVRHQQFPERAT
jgi:hypothetical protein